MSFRDARLSSATCLIDQLWPSVGVATVEVLRRVGREVVFDPRQTCCGQPAFNTGYRSEAAVFARRFVEIFEDGGIDAIVSPSGSCTAMVHHFRDVFAEDEQWRSRAESVAERTHELRRVSRQRHEGRERRSDL